MKIWITTCCYVLLALLLPVSNAKPHGRHRRQFPFGASNSAKNQIFFDDDNFFNDMVVQQQSTGSNQNNGQWQRPSTTTTPRSAGTTTVVIPGMGTTQSACENRCLTTFQYDPVCGDNNKTYANIARYQCAVRCGEKVRIAAYKACPLGPIGR